MATDRGIGDWGIYPCRFSEGRCGGLVHADPDEIVDAETLLYRRHVLIDPSGAQAEFGGDCLELMTFRHQLQHFALARGQCRQVEARMIVSGFQVLALPGGIARPLR